MTKGYGNDLAYVHDAGFGDFARNAAPGILVLLRGAGIRSGLVIDLGCGSGIWAAELIRAGYDVLGIDQSPAMLQLARKRAPRAEFVQGSLFKAKLPPCNAVTCIGECLNYTFDPSSSLQGLEQVFRRVHSALRPEGIFVFDIAMPGMVNPEFPRHLWREGKDWAILLDRHEDKKKRLFTRRMTVFRKVGTTYRRTEETHVVRLYRPAEITRILKRVGFKVRPLARYGRFRRPPSNAAFLAIKPA